MPSFIFRPTVWPQYTNVTDRQTDRQRSDIIGLIVLQTVAQKLKVVVVVVVVVVIVVVVVVVVVVVIVVVAVVYS